MTVISGRTDAPEVRFDLTDTHAHTQTDPTTVTLAVHAHRGLMNALKCRTLCTMSSCHCGQTLLGGMTNERQLYMVNTIMRMRAFRRKMAGLYIHVWPSTEAVLDLCKGEVSEKTPQIFGPPLPAEYVTVLSGDIPEVRCDLTDTHLTTVTLIAHARRGLMMIGIKAHGSLSNTLQWNI